MILAAALLVGIGGVLVLVGVRVGSLVWFHGAIAAAIASLLVLGIGVARELRRPAACDGGDAGGGAMGDAVRDADPEPRQPDDPT